MRRTCCDGEGQGRGGVFGSEPVSVIGRATPWAVVTDWGLAVGVVFTVLGVTLAIVTELVAGLKPMRSKNRVAWVLAGTLDTSTETDTG